MSAACFSRPIGCAHWEWFDESRTPAGSAPANGQPLAPQRNLAHSGAGAGARRFRAEGRSWCALLAAALWFAGWPPAFAQTANSVATAAQQILEKNCGSCHGDARVSGLDIRQRTSLLQGGTRGPAVVPGFPEKSLLYVAAAHTGSLKMPPDSKGPLPPQDLKILREWISQPSNFVAPSIFSAEQKAHWAFQPVKDPMPPKVKDEKWVKNDVDRFVLARLEEKGLEPSPPADKRTLIRRLAFDLTGLPPTPEEIRFFLADPSPEAYSKLVDRMLASPRYGERWGRHWLDVARYAETNAFDGNFLMLQAHRYRDYVIRAFNDDKPYDQFIIEQLAGDLLPPTKDIDLGMQRVIATGFLLVGPKPVVEQDKEQVLLDIVDEQIDASTKAFLGLTVACARCHDHKFDPIPTRDYYSLAGIFKSTQSIPNPQTRFPKWTEYPLLRIPGQEPIIAMAVRDGTSGDMKVLVGGNYSNPGEEAPRRFLRIIAGENQAPIQTGQSGRLELARGIASPANPLTGRVMANRIWQWHFGQALVPTSDNFGMKGEEPSHPDLLDWLTSRFIQNNWSVKSLHRLVLLSSAYQMQSNFNDKAAKIDPENRLLWRMNRRRLEVEELRDSILAVSGQIDTTMGGPTLAEDWKKGAQIISKEEDLYAPGIPDLNRYDTTRRTVYLPLIRNRLHEMLRMFDYGDATTVNSKREETTVPTQALFLMNNQFIREQAKHFAEALLGLVEVRLLVPRRKDTEEKDNDYKDEAKEQEKEKVKVKEGGDWSTEELLQMGYRHADEARDEDRIRLAHLRVLGRLASDDEVNRALHFVADVTKALRESGKSETEIRLAAWQRYCRSLFLRNEFLYVD